MPDNDLQSIVDELAERLRRSVAIDDPSIRLLVASRHFGDEDAVRVRSVLDRAVEQTVTDSIFAQHIAGWTTPGMVEVPGLTPRLCAPVRCHGLLLGYLWLIVKAGVVLYRRLLLHERSKARHEAILRELVSPDTTVRAQAIEDLRSEQLFGIEATVTSRQHPGTSECPRPVRPRPRHQLPSAACLLRSCPRTGAPLSVDARDVPATSSALVR